MSRVDVVIPCYRYGRFLRECVESILSQPVDVRVLILDDASPDETPEVGRELAARDPRVEYRRHPENRGHTATYNEGLLEWARADYCVLISADDLLTPGSLARAVRFLDDHPEVGFVYGRTIRFLSGEALPAPRSTAADCSGEVVPGTQWIEAMCRRGTNCLFSPEVVVRTRLQHAVGGYRKELPHGGDMEMWLRLAAQADVGVLDADQAYYRVHGTNMHVRQFGAVLVDIRERCLVFETFFGEWGRRLPERGRLEALAMAALAREAVDEAYHAFCRRDLRTCAECLAFAERLYPPSRSWRLYRRVVWLRRAGPGVWALLRRLRGVPEPAGSGSAA